MNKPEPITEDALLDSLAELQQLIEEIGIGTSRLRKAVREFQDGHNYNASVAAQSACHLFRGAERTARLIADNAWNWSSWMKEEIKP
jgi:exonuclease VII small subunit